MASSVSGSGVVMGSGPRPAGWASGHHRIDHDVDAKLRIVLGEKTFVAEIIVPLAAVVLAAVEHADPTVDDDGLQIVVHEVVPPAVQFEGRGRRSLLEAKERPVEGMVIRDLHERIRPEDHTHLLLEGPGEEAVD